MRKRVGLAFFFLALIGLTLALGLYCNAYTPILRLEEKITEKMAQQIYAVDINPLRGKSVAPTISFSVAQADLPLSMLVSGTTHFSAYSGEQLLYRYDDSGHVHRIHVFPLPQSILSHGSLDITFETENGLSRADILLGNSAGIEALAAASDNISMLILGMLLMITLYSISLYIAKQSERYLAMLAIISALTTVVYLNDMSNPLLHLPRWLSEPIRSFSQIGPSYIFALVLLSLCRIELPQKFSALSKKPIVYILLALVYILCLSLNQFSIYIEPSVRIAFIVFTAIILLTTQIKQEKGTLLLIGGYAVFHGLGTCFDIIKPLYLVTGGTLPVLVRLPQLGNLVFLCCATVKINFRFADKFSKTETLATELDALNLSLDLKVAKRTRQLAEQQEQKHRLMLNIFHDLRSPIFIVKGMLSKLRKNVQMDAMREEMGILAERIDFMDQLTEDLFMIAKLEEKDLLLVMDTVDFSVLCLSQCDAASFIALDKGVSFHPSISPGAMVWGDQMRLEQALQNLLTNAITYTPKGGSVYVSLEIKEKDCILTVRDTGHGISEADIPLIFSRYYRVDRAANSKSTGLGLSIAYEIIELHEGKLWVQSNNGEGSTFLVSLQTIQ